VLVEVDFENACFAMPLGAMVESQAKDLHRPCRCRQRRRMSVVFLIGGAGCGASSTPLVGLCSSREILALGSRASYDGSYIVTFLEAIVLLVHVSLAFWLVDVGAAALNSF
jgi:hypothetical protein